MDNEICSCSFLSTCVRVSIAFIQWDRFIFIFKFQVCQCILYTNVWVRVNGEMLTNSNKKQKNKYELLINKCEANWICIYYPLNKLKIPNEMTAFLHLNMKFQK